MKHKLLTLTISLLMLTGLILIGISLDKILKLDKVFLLTGIGLGLLINARYLETIRKDD